MPDDLRTNRFGATETTRLLLVEEEFQFLTDKQVSSRTKDFHDEI
jgi:hypothetical protein